VLFEHFVAENSLLQKIDELVGFASFFPAELRIFFFSSATCYALPFWIFLRIQIPAKYLRHY